jgi:putative ABC transport system ATP-binding protein
VYLQVEHVSKEFERNGQVVVALDDVNLSIESGEVIGLQGASGAGKSTLLNVIGGLERPSVGDVIFEKKRINDLSDEDLALYRRQTVGFVFQSSHLLAPLTVFENVMLPLVPMVRSEAEKAERVEEVLERARISHRSDHLPGELSGGEQQRAAIARAIVNAPQIVLADEPTGELDEANADNIIELLTSLSTEGVTVVIASHDRRVLEAAGRLVTMHDGALSE